MNFVPAPGLVGVPKPCVILRQSHGPADIDLGGGRYLMRGWPTSY